MVTKVNWRDVPPNVAHATAVVWSILGPKGSESEAYGATPLQGFQALTLHGIQPGKAGDYHAHFDREQVYYFTGGSGKMNVDEEIYSVKKRDGICLPPTCFHQIINDTDEWVYHLILNGNHVSSEEQEKNKEVIASTTPHGPKRPIAHRNWMDGTPHVASHGPALIWSIFGPKDAPDLTFTEAPMESFKSVSVHRVQPRQRTVLHSHENHAQIYYVTEGTGKMTIGKETVEVQEGDAIHTPPRVPHGIINDTDLWLEHLIISGQNEL